MLPPRYWCCCICSWKNKTEVFYEKETVTDRCTGDDGISDAVCFNSKDVAGRLTRVQGRELQLRLDTSRRDFLQQIKDRPLTLEERSGLSRRLDMLEVDMNRVW